MKTHQSTTARDAAALFTLLSGWVVGYGIHQSMSHEPLDSDFWSALVLGLLCAVAWIKEEIDLRVARKLAQAKHQEELPERLDCGFKLGLPTTVTDHMDLSSLRKMVADQEHSTRL